MNLIDKAFFLKKIPLFASLDLDLLLTIADKMSCEMRKKETPIFQMGQEASLIYFLAAGDVTLQNKQTSLHILAPDYFGEESCLSGKARTYSAHCRSDTCLLTLTQPHFLAILTECPQAALSLLESYASSIDFRKR